MAGFILTVVSPLLLGLDKNDPPNPLATQSIFNKKIKRENTRGNSNPKELLSLRR